MCWCSIDKYICFVLWVLAGICSSWNYHHVPSACTTMAAGDRDLPFIPILSNIASSSNSHSTRSGRSRRHPSSNDDREAREISQLLLKFTEQIQVEKRRADEAERKTREVTEHLRRVNDARLRALQEAQKANEELKLYKTQLLLAQREVNRAQDVLQVVDRQRHQAEKEAAKTRSRFRQLNEDMLVHQAREEGRRMGIQEGLARGRDLVFQENRALNSFAEDDSQDIEDIDEDYDLDSIDQSHSSISDTADDDVDFQSRPPSTFEHIRPSTPPPPLPIPMPRQEPIPVPPSIVRSSPPRPLEIVPPVSVRGVTPSPRRPNVPIPPDNFIPHLDQDNILRMPPPFEFQRAATPERPQTPSVTGRDSDEPLMVPGPRAISSQNRHYPRPSSPESNSTTISQFEMVNEPFLSALRTPMSVIPEVQSDQSSPTPQMNGHRDLRHQHSSGSHASYQVHPTANLANRDRSKRGTHSRRPSNGSLSAPLQAMPPSTYQRHKSSSSSGSLASIDIAIQPPSRPLSHISQDRNSSRRLRPPNSPEFTMGPSSTATATNQEAMPGGYSSYVKSQESGGPPPVIPDPKLYGPDTDDDAVSSAQSYDTLTTPPPSNGRNESAWNAGLALSGQVPLFSSSVTSKGAPVGKTRKSRT